jgi:hypothetical protein
MLVVGKIRVVELSMGLSIGAKSIIIATISVFAVGSGFIGIFFINNIAIRGEIVFLDFEGGFYGVIGNNEKHYDPINLPNEFQEEGLKILVIARISENQISFHMRGIIIEIRYFKII